EVTSVSGRGVGLDVVKTNVEKIGGTVEVSSTRGEGSTFVIKIPLTLAIVSALIVEACDQRFAIPQISVIELVRAAGNAEHTVEMINNTPVLRLRDRLLPLVSLSQVLRLETAQEEFDTESETFIVVSQVGTYSFGIIVDRVFDTEEIVVKPVAPMMRDIGVFSGNTILGDGSIVMILDPNGLATAGVDSAAIGTVEDDTTAAAAGRDDTRAVPLALVARVEEIERSEVEISDGKPVVQYRGQLMPLVLSDESQSIEGDGKVSIVVFSEDGRSMGLVVDEIIDIIDEVLSIEIRATQPGIAGSAVVDGKATDIIDAGYYLTQAFNDWFNSGAQRNQSNGEKRRLLLVDDSPFFRNLLAPLLSAAGYDVTMAEDGDKALEILAGDSEFDIIVSDIEMPGTNGFELAKACRNDERWKETPIVALSAHTSTIDIDRGREAGFTDYVAKSDRDGLLSALAQSLTITGDAA
ncbi:MAG: chemotaxis protein CheW, partial [Acidobacteria bacterium]|nr:chemotaxis protein CheW [Acidobacteriota bacterium]